jgi:hypothetical protein
MTADVVRALADFRSYSEPRDGYGDGPFKLGCLLSGPATNEEIASAWPIAVLIPAQEAKPVNRRGWIAVAVLVVAGALAAYGITRFYAPTAAKKSLAQIQVTGYEKTGEGDESFADNTTSSGVYVGLAVQDASLVNIVTGPHVRVSTFASPRPGVDENTNWVAGGSAPGGCGLMIEKYRGGGSPFDWWNVTGSQMAQVREGKLEILEISTVCGKG